MFCGKCGHEIENNTLFCGNCGEKTEENGKNDAIKAPEIIVVDNYKPVNVTPANGVVIQKTKSDFQKYGWILGIVGVVVLILIGISLSNQSGNKSTSSNNQAQYVQDFTMVNNTGVDIYYIYASPVYSDNWEEDVLGNNILYDGESFPINFYGYPGVQYWDIMVEDLYGNRVYWDNLDLFSIRRMTLRNTNQGTYADFD